MQPDPLQHAINIYNSHLNILNNFHAFFLSYLQKPDKEKFRKAFTDQKELQIT